MTLKMSRAAAFVEEMSWGLLQLITLTNARDSDANAHRLFSFIFCSRLQPRGTWPATHLQLNVSADDRIRQREQERTKMV